ncbi:ClpP/crotonase-like domain-containing protein [Pilaira anomala]|nr:ClpP/crotonase-like domain-containing protein [Pilaira anomala]
MNSTTLSYFSDKGQGTVRLDLTYQPGIALVTLDNPKRHNALSGKMMVEFHHIITRLEKNTNDLVAVIFIGADLKSFCAGLDLSFAREYLSNPKDTMAINEMMYHAIDKLTQLPLITMAVALGGSIGGGSELITAFDFICMSQESGFVHFVQTRMGVSSPWGGMARLISIVGKKKGLIWMAGGAKIDAKEAFEHGLVDLLVEKDLDCLDQTLLFLKPFLWVDESTQKRVSPVAVRGMKQLAVVKKEETDWKLVQSILSGTLFSKL